MAKASHIKAILARVDALLHVQCLRVDQAAAEQAGVDRYEIPQLGGAAPIPAPSAGQEQLTLDMDAPSGEPGEKADQRGRLPEPRQEPEKE